MTDAPLFPFLLDLSDLALFLRIWIGILFGWSGWLHVTDPRERGKSIGRFSTSSASSSSRPPKVDRSECEPRVT